MVHPIIYSWLVVLTILQNICQLGVLFPYIMEKMFETTNQIWNIVEPNWMALETICNHLPKIWLHGVYT